MYSLPDNYLFVFLCMNTLQSLSAYRFSASQLNLFRQLGELKGHQILTARQQPEVLDSLRQIALMESVEYSNHLDNIMVSRDTVRKLVQYQLRPVSPMDRQVAGYRDALDMVVEPGEHLTLSVSLIRQLHAMLYAHLPHEGGRWRPTNKDIVERDKNGKRIGILYHTVPVSELPAAMEKTIALYHEAITKGIDPLLAIAAVTLDFMCVHPFSDGNGRIVRLLMLLMLANNGYNTGQLVSIEKILADDKAAYWHAWKSSVKGWHEGKHDPMPWINFFLKTLIRAGELMEQKVNDLHWQGVRAPKSQLIKTAIERVEGTFSVADICIEIPTVSRELVKKVIQQLKAEGSLKAVGKGRGAQWQKVA